MPLIFIVVDNLERFTLLQTYIDGVLVAEKDNSLIDVQETATINNFSIDPKQPSDFGCPCPGAASTVTVNVIDALDGQLITTASSAELPVENGFIGTDTVQDVLKIGVVNRYGDAPVATGFIRNFGLQQGAGLICGS